MSAPLSIRTGLRADRLGAVHELMAILRLANVTADASIPCTLALDMRHLSAAEREGAVWALDRIRTWTGQLEGVAGRMSDDPADALPMTPRARYIAQLRLAHDLAHAQQLALS